jgi:cyclophilin family peptidyl-prolyl cis-trans isomerase
MKSMLIAASAALVLGLPAFAQEAAKPAALAPSEIVAAAPKADWVAIPAEDLLVMTLAPDAESNPRTVVIQLMPAPFAQGWVHNIRLFARAGWYDGISVNRVQDNYVTQWGDPNYDNPEATGKPKPLPQGLKVMGEADYTSTTEDVTNALFQQITGANPAGLAEPDAAALFAKFDFTSIRANKDRIEQAMGADSYAKKTVHLLGWPLGQDYGEMNPAIWPTHCYGMVGVGRNYSPDTGSGAELYTVIGHAPRHLDRNIALVGRVIEGMEHLSSLPRGKGALGFYAADEAHKRTPILSVRVASDLAPADPASSSEAVGQQTRPAFEYLSTESGTFAAYAEAIANRRDPFFITPAGGADICNIRVPVRRVAQ